MEHPKVFVLPKSATYPEPTAFLKLPHPRTGAPALFLPQETHDLLELQTIQPPQERERSWFMDEKCVEDGRLYILTPFDVAFFYASLMYKQTHFLPLDDLMDTCAETALCMLQSSELNGDAKENGADAVRLQMNHDINVVSKLTCSKSAIDRICDKQVVGDIETYRLSKPNLQSHLKKKVENLSEPSLFNSIPSFHRLLAKNGLVGEGVTVDEDVLSQARIHVCINFISSYLNKEVEELLRQSFELDKYEKYVKERSEAFELSSEYHPGLNRNGSSNSKQLGEVANTKKTKSSRGVEALKKVNIKGMKKMTDFFTKN